MRKLEILLKLSAEELFQAGPVTPENINRYVELKIKHVYYNFIKGVEFVIRLSYLKLLTPIELEYTYMP